MIRPKSEFTYVIRTVKGNKFIMIEDKNLGRMSVTNDIENVVDYICEKEKIDAVKDYTVIYKDSQELWTHYNVKDNTFGYLEYHWMDLVKKLV